MTAVPRFATPRTLERETLGPQVCSVMGGLGLPPMPWQENGLNVAMELDDTGELVYSVVIWVVPRQAGKTATTLAVQVHRATYMAKRLGKPQKSLYLAQKGLDSRKKLYEDHLPILDSSPFNGLYKAVARNGDEGIFWKNGSIHHVAAPTAKAGHGQSLDLVHIDEAFVHSTNDVEQGVRPTMITRPNSQLWIISAAGNEKSTYLQQKVEQGRDMVRRDEREGVCYLEYSAPEDADITDRKVWALSHPAVGQTIKLRDLEAEFNSMDEAEFIRAYLGIWPKKTRPRVIPEERWDACKNVEAIPLDPVSFAIDVSPDRKHAAISAAGFAEDGKYVVEVIDNRKGTDWIVDRVQELLRNAPKSTVSFDQNGPAGSLIPEFDRKKVPYRLLTTADIGRAAGFLVDKVYQRKLWHRDDRALNIALAGVSQRKIGDKWGWDRTPGLDVTPLQSVTLALWARETVPAATKFKMGLIA